jgi:hypothetical protein
VCLLRCSERDLGAGGGGQGERERKKEREREGPIQPQWGLSPGASGVVPIIRTCVLKEGSCHCFSELVKMNVDGCGDRYIYW